MAHDGAEKSRRGWGRAAASRACRCWAAGWTGRRRLRHQAGLAGTPRAGSTGARPQRARTSRVPRAVHGTGGHAPATNRARAGTTGVPPRRARPRRARRAFRPTGHATRGHHEPHTARAGTPRPRTGHGRAPRAFRPTAHAPDGHHGPDSARARASASWAAQASAGTHTVVGDATAAPTRVPAQRRRQPRCWQPS